MSKPIIKSGKFHAGADLQCGENVVIDVAEEVVVGDRVVLPDNAYFGGRRATIGDDFFGYSWEWKRLDVGRNRRDDEHATLTIGSRCTLHDARIDLAAPVVIGDDVGLSPEVALYCHYYWQSVLDGFPWRYAGVTVGDLAIVGFRSVLLPGANVPKGAVIGAQSVVSGALASENAVFVGSPARFLRRVRTPDRAAKESMLADMITEYAAGSRYRGYTGRVSCEYPVIQVRGARIDVDAWTLDGSEDEHTDDLRWFLFTRGIRIYTRRPFTKLGRKA